MLLRRMAFAASVLFGCVWSGTALAEPTPPSPGLTRALDDLSQWLQTAGQEGWHKYLKSDLLRAQIAAGENADVQALREVLARYDSKVAGLDQVRFHNVRKSLAVWVERMAMPSAAELPEAARAALGAFREVSSADAEKARADLIAKLNAVKKLTATWSNGKDWERKLCWELEHELNKEAGPDVVALERIAQRHQRHVAGDMPQFGDLRMALSKYLQALRVVGDANAAETCKQQMELLAASLEAYPKARDEAELAKIAAALAWLENHGQAADLVAAARHHYSRNNLHVQMSAKLVTAGFNQEVDDEAPITDTIMGTSITGTGKTKGQVSAQLIPNDRVALIHNFFDGRTNSHTTGRNGGATILTRGITDFKAIKQVSLDQFGFHNYNAVATARTDATPYSVDSGYSGIARATAQSVAWSRVRESRAEANRISSEHAAERVKNRLDNTAQERMEKTNKNFRERFRYPLLDKGAFPESMLFSTTPDSLRVDWLQTQALSLAAAEPPPPADGEFDFSARVHQSMLNNFFASYFRAPRGPGDEPVDERTMATFGPEANVLHGRFMTRSQLAAEMERFRPTGKLHRQVSAVDTAARTITTVGSYQRTLTLSDDAKLVDDDGSTDVFPKAPAATTPPAAAAAPAETEEAKNQRAEDQQRLHERLGQMASSGQAVILDYAPGQPLKVTRVRLNKQPPAVGSVRVVTWHLSQRAITVSVDTQQKYTLAPDAELTIRPNKMLLLQQEEKNTLEQVAAKVKEEMDRERTVTAELEFVEEEKDKNQNGAKENVAKAPRPVARLKIVNEWEVRFDGQQPISVNFLPGDRVLVTIRYTHFSSSPQATVKGSSPMEVAAVYHLLLKDDKLVAEQETQGEVERTDEQGNKVKVKVGVVIGRRNGIAYKGDGKLELSSNLRPAESVSAEDSLDDFQTMLKSEFTMDDITLPEKWQKAGVLRMKHVAFHGNWLSLGWVLAPERKSEVSVGAK